MKPVKENMSLEMITKCMRPAFKTTDNLPPDLATAIVETY